MSNLVLCINNSAVQEKSYTKGKEILIQSRSYAYSWKDTWGLWEIQYGGP